MKRADIPANIFAAGFFLTLALMTIVVAPIVVLAWAIDLIKDDRDV